MRTLLFVMMLFAGANAAWASDHVTEAERLALERAVQYLEDAERLVEVAQSQSSDNTRFALDYDLLLTDIELIHQNLSRHLSEPARSPRRAPRELGVHTPDGGAR